MAAKSYRYPNSKVLINKLDIRDFDKLVEIERQYSYFRLAQLQVEPIKGKFDLKHLQGIHKHLFKDIYSWAGELRTLNISKGNTMFAPSHVIKPYADDLFDKLKRENYLKGLDIDKFAERLSFHASEINIIHPFREGNGRSTREFLRELADQASYEIKYQSIPKQELYNAFIKSVEDYSDLKRIFKNNIISNIKEHYLEELPHMKNASESLLNKLQEIKQLLGEGEYLSIKHIKNVYKELGRKVDSGILSEEDPLFKLTSEINTEIKILKVQNMNKEFESGKSLNNIKFHNEL